MSNLIEHINLVDGLNMNPIPLEFSQSMTTTEWLLAIQHKVNSIIDMGNAWETNANKYTNEKCKAIQNEYDELMKLLKNGALVPDGSLDINKLKPTFLTDLQNIILNYVHDTTKFVIFGLDKKGYFCADIPDSWDEIQFSTNSEGQLCLTTLSNKEDNYE